MSPRDGSGVYSSPPGTHGTPNTTILSANYNSNVDDVATDLNTPRPIVAGGTGATTAAGALTALGAVAKAGDTISGDLTIAKAVIPRFILNKTAASQTNVIDGKYNGVDRWAIELGNSNTETGSNSGSDFVITCCNDAGALLNTPIYINRASGLLTTGAHVANGSVTSITAANTGTYLFGNSATKFLAFDGTYYSFNAGNSLLVGGTVISYTGASTGAFYFGSSLNNSLTFNGTNFIFASPSGGAVGAAGYIIRPGTAGVLGNNNFNFNWTGTLSAWIDATNVGTVTLTSDYRIKKDVIDLPGTWEAVKALRPIAYTQADFSPPSHLAHIAKAQKDGMEVDDGPLFVADDIERWGFLAHELQATLIESAASGVKDSPDTVQSPNSWTVIAALTKALQEAMARIEALEAA